jgi:hypothetical protein
MIEILLGALFERELREVFVVVVLLEDDDVRFGNGFDDAAGDRGLARAGAAANPDNQGPAVEWSNRRSPISDAVRAASLR